MPVSVLSRYNSIPAKWFTFGDQLVVSGSNFLSGILLSVFIGLDQYGIFAGQWLIVLFVSSLHQSFVTMPLFTLFFRQENNKEYSNRLTGLQWRLSILTMLLVFAGIQLYRLFTEGSFVFSLQDLLIAILSGQFIWHDYTRRLLVVQERPQIAFLLDLVVYGMQPVLFLTVHLLWEIDLNTTLFILLILLLTGMIISFKTLNGFGCSPGKKLISEHWVFGRFLIFSAMLQWFSGNSFLVAGSLLLTPLEFAAIRIGQNLIGVSTVFFQFLENTVPLKLARTLQVSGHNEMRREFLQLMFRNSIPFICFLILLSLLRNWLLQTIYGAETAAFGWIILLLCLLQVFVYTGTFLRFYFRTIENNRRTFIGYVLATAVSTIIAHPIVESYGISGVFAGLFITQLLVLIPMLRLRQSSLL